MIINHNNSSMFASRQLAVNGTELAKSLEKLSSGVKINKAGDDASGLAVSEKMRSQIRGLNQASKNIGNGISFIQTAEGYLNETTDILQRIRELSVQSSNGLFTEEDRMQINVEVSSLISEVDRIASQAQFNGMNILTGAFAKEVGSMSIHVGANTDQNVNINIERMDSVALGLTDQSGAKLNVLTAEDSNTAIAVLDNALKTVSKQRADLGAYQNRLETMQNGVNTAADNLQASESRIRDTDMAAEMVELTKRSVLSQSGTAMLSQANSKTANVLSILR